MRISQRIKEIYTTEGISGVLTRIKPYISNRFRNIHRSKIRPYLPESAQHGLFHGVKVTSPKLKLFDTYVPWRTDSKIPNYKTVNVSAIKDIVEPGDHVVIIGGGKGVTSVNAALKVGREGLVTIYEGDPVRGNELRETLQRHNVSERCHIEQQFVGTAFCASNKERSEYTVPENLPEADVLEMDCEGAEWEVLDEMVMRPRDIIVETHFKKEYAPYDTEEDLVELIVNQGYDVEQRTGPWLNSLLIGRRSEVTDKEST